MELCWGLSYASFFALAFLNILFGSAKAEIIQITYQATVTDAHYSNGLNTEATSLLGPTTIYTTFDTSTGTFKALRSC
ncbi:hypothetical protein ACVWVY_003744 [Bradyrhizobium sp. URHC0002]